MSKQPPKSLDRRFKHLGRIKREWGTDHVPTRRRMDEMVTILFASGEWDILRGIKDGTYTPLEVFSLYRINGLERLPTAASMAPLKSRMESWIEKKECSDSHRRSLAQSLRHLSSSARQSTRSTVADLPRLLTGLRDSFLGSHPRSFNLARAAAQAFVKSTQGRTSNLWSEITNIEVLKVTPQRRKHPLTPDELREIADRLHPMFGDMVWTMACTGMGPDEYWSLAWRQLPDRIRIEGTKRVGRRRDVPRLIGIAAPAVGYAAFRRYLRDASKGTVAPYDLRRTYANWLESAGIPRTRRKLYMGHGARDVTDLYERHEVERFLVEDAAKLRAYVFGTESTGLKLEKA